MGFLESGFGIFALIMIWNIFLLGFGGVTDSPLLEQTNIPGYNTVGQIGISDVGSGATQATPYIAPTTTPEQNIPYYQDATASIGFITSIVGKIVFGASDAIIKSGIPSPINWVMGTIITVFMTAYLGLLLLSFASAIFGGGVGQT